MTDSMRNNHPFPAEPTQIIYVEGSDRQIGQQHAEQLGAKIAQGMAPFYTAFFDRVSNPLDINFLEKVGLGCLQKGLDQFLVQKLIQQIPMEFKERISGMSEVSQVEEGIFLKAFILPDLLPMLQAYLIRLKPQLGISVALPQFGCSSFISKNKSFYLGRNLDFPGVAYWDRYPVIQVTRPKNKLSYIAMTSAGVPLGGISGVNESGISVALHQHYTTHTDRGGLLPFVITERILSEAKSLDDALSLIQSHPLASSWAFVIADGKAQNGFIYEATPKISGIRWLAEEGNVLTHTNYFVSKNCKGRDYATTERMNWDNFWRRTTLDGLLRTDLEDFSVERGLEAISNHTDGFWKEEKTINRTVSQVYNIQSYLIDFTQQKLFLAEGNCPIHLQSYREYDLNELFQGKKGASNKSRLGYSFKDPHKKLAKQEYILSFVSAFDGKDEQAFQRLQSSLELSFTPEASIVAALMNLRLDGNIDASLDFLVKGEIAVESKVRNQENSIFPPEYFEILLYQARVHDLKGERSEASRLYKKILAHSDLRDANIRKASEGAKSYSLKRAKRLIMPYSTYIPFD